MTISQAIAALSKLREQVGDVQVCADCPRCACAFEVGVVVTGPVVAKLRQEKAR